MSDDDVTGEDTAADEAVGPVELRADGSVLVDLDDGDERVRLRRPKLGQYRAYREAYDEAVERLREHLAPVRDQLGELQAQADEVLSGKAADDRLDPDERAAVREVLTRVDETSRELRQRAEQAAENEWPQWWLMVLGQLGAGTAPDGVDELPSWTTDGTVIARVLEHWRSVPLAPGRRR